MRLSPISICRIGVPKLRLETVLLKMRTGLYLLALCLVATGASQSSGSQDPGAARASNEALNKKINELIKQGTGERDKYWTKSSLTLSQLAQKVAAATKSPKGTLGVYQILAQTSEGRGVYGGEMRFQQPNVFKLNWVHIQPDPLNGIFLANGKIRQSIFDGKLSPVVSASKIFSGVTTDPAQLVARFSNEFTRFLFQGATDGKDAWVPLLTAWSKGAGGYKLFVQERNITFQNRSHRGFRIKLDRTAAAAKTMGKSSLEVVFDGHRFLPITVRELRTDKQGKPWVIQWSGNYKFDQKFQPSDFEMKGAVAKDSR